MPVRGAGSGGELPVTGVVVPHRLSAPRSKRLPRGNAGRRSNEAWRGRDSRYGASGTGRWGSYRVPQGATAMTTGRLGQQAAPPNAAYAGQVVHSRTRSGPPATRGVCGWTSDGYPDFSPYARAAAEIAEPPEGFGVDELRLTDYVSANAALRGGGARAVGHDPRRWRPRTAGRGTTWSGSRRLELVPVEVKALLRHHGGLATARGRPRRSAGRVRCRRRGRRISGCRRGRWR